jgi:electron transfer flavoprotein alpha subunit
MGHILIFAESRGKKPHPISFELLGKGRELAEKTGDTLCAVAFSLDENNARELIYYGADRVYLYQNVGGFSLEGYKKTLASFARELGPDIFLFGATRLGRVLGPGVAARLGAGITADCIGFDIDKGKLTQVRPAFSGNILAHIKTRTIPQMATVRYRVMEKAKRDPGRKGQIIHLDPGAAFSELLHGVEKSCVSLPDAEIIVSGGRGIGGPEGFNLLEELASELGGVVGASRPVVDDGWIGREHQVGFSGNTVRPKLYIAIGISGSAQHLAGMNASETVVAINRDSSAPIFRHSDYGIIGDFKEVVPQLISELRSIKKVSS